MRKVTKFPRICLKPELFAQTPHQESCGAKFLASVSDFPIQPHFILSIAVKYCKFQKDDKNAVGVANDQTRLLKQFDFSCHFH